MNPLRILLLAATLAISIPAFAQEAGKPSDKNLLAKPKRAVLFKNGLGLIDASVSLPSPAGRFQLSPLPDATLGMFWLTGSPGLFLTDIKATQTFARDKTAITIPDLIEANLGKTAELKINNEWRKVTLKELPQSENPQPPISPRYDPYNQPETSSIPTPIKAIFVIVQEADNTTAIQLSLIQEVRLAGPMELKLNRPAKTLAFTSALADAANPTPAPELNLTYLAQNITWAPSYRVELIDDTKATLYAKAIIANDLTALDNVHVELVTGYPNLEFSHISDFFSLHPIRVILNAIQTPPAQRDSYSFNMMAQQRSNYRAAAAGALDGSVMPPGQLTGESSEDLYFYPIKSVTLAKGERGYFEVFTAPVDYQHVYTWDVPDYITEDYYRSNQRTDAVPPQAVWHALKLTNKSPMPWTTGPGATTKSGRVLGQSMLNYTPVNGTTELKITQVSAINAEQTENEIERKRNAATFYSSNYDLVTISGELQLTNYTDKTVTVKITKILSGDVQKTDNNPVISKLARGLKSVNPKSQLAWTITVEPGKDKSICAKYTYQVYVRN